MTKRAVSIAIDGPSGAGKSTMAKRIAEHFGYIYIDTGAIYRSVALYAIRRRVDSGDIAGIIALLDKVHLELIHDDRGGQRMILNGEDVSDAIRLPEVSMYTSNLSAIQQVREFLLDMQRDYAKKYDVVMDGRDIGTVVLPDATIKIFLTAAPENRARRRYEELRGKGVDTTYESVLTDLLHRDKNDSSRQTAPLKPADDALIVDTSGNTIQETANILINLVKEKLSHDRFQETL